MMFIAISLAHSHLLFHSHYPLTANLSFSSLLSHIHHPDLVTHLHPGLTATGLNVVQGTWQILPSNSATYSLHMRRLPVLVTPVSRVSASWVANNATSLMFGGALSSSLTVFNDLWEMDMTQLLWVNRPPLYPGAIWPPGRCAHAAAAVPSGPGPGYTQPNHLMLLFGGIASSFNSIAFNGFEPGDLLGDTWVYDLQQRSWTQLRPPNSPLPRFGASMTHYSDPTQPTFVFLFGGATIPGGQGSLSSISTLDDAWMFSMQSQSWLQLTQTSRPQSRMFFSLATQMEESPTQPAVVMHGGHTGTNISIFVGGDFLSDTLVGYYAPNLTWVWSPLQMGSATRVAYHVSFVHYDLNSSLILLGGMAPASAALDPKAVTLLVPVDDLALQATLGCNPGSQAVAPSSFTRCNPCPVGSYASKAGGPCITCPSKVYTPVVGATAIQQCSVCSDDYCHGHGTCSVDLQTFRPTCTCQVGYSGDTCNVGWLLITGVTVGVVLLVVVVLQRSWGRLRRGFAQTTSSYMLKEALLRNELEEFRRGWEIDTADVVFEKKIDVRTESNR